MNNHLVENIQEVSIFLFFKIEFLNIESIKKKIIGYT